MSDLNTIALQLETLLNKANEATLKKWITTAGIAVGTIGALIGAWKLGSVLTQFSAWIKATNLVLAAGTKLYKSTFSPASLYQPKSV